MVGRLNNNFRRTTWRWRDDDQAIASPVVPISVDESVGRWRPGRELASRHLSYLLHSDGRSQLSGR